MTINITNSIEQHKIPQRITEIKHTDLSCHMGSCMAHLNSLPLRAAGVNYLFFLLPLWWWVLVKSKMRDTATQNRRRNECAKLWVFREIAKWRR